MHVCAVCSQAHTHKRDSTGTNHARGGGQTPCITSKMGWKSSARARHPPPRVVPHGGLVAELVAVGCVVAGHVVAHKRVLAKARHPTPPNPRQKGGVGEWTDEFLIAWALPHPPRAHKGVRRGCGVAHTSVDGPLFPTDVRRLLHRRRCVGPTVSGRGTRPRPARRSPPSAATARRGQRSGRRPRAAAVGQDTASGQRARADGAGGAAGVARVSRGSRAGGGGGKRWARAVQTWVMRCTKGSHAAAVRLCANMAGFRPG